MTAPRLAVWLLLAAPAHAQPHAAPFCDKVRALIAEPAVAAAHWGVLVTTLDGASLCGINDAQLFRPASNAKLFTAVAALALFGPDSRVTTTITFSSYLRIQADFKSDLILKGAGDGYLSTRPMPFMAPGKRPVGTANPPNPLEGLADAVAASGLKHLTGDIIGDDTAWPYEPYPGDWSIDDMQWGYGAPVSALTVDDNKLALTVAPGATVGSPASVTLAPAGGFYQLDVSANTVAAKAPASIAIDRVPGSRTLRVYGTVPLDAPYEQDIAIADPAEYVALRLKSLLEARGIVIDGRAIAHHRLPINSESFEHQVNQPFTLVANPPVAGVCFDACPLTFDHISPSLLDDVTLTLKVSQNLHAELLLHRLGAAFGREGSTAQGIRVVRQFWLDAGLRPADFYLNDGSGLSTHDLATPRALTQLLVFAATRSWFAGFRAALPIGGVDGSLAGRFHPETSALTGRLFAKTGTLGESRALSGYVTAASGRTLVLTVMVDTHMPNSTADRTAMDRIVEAIAAGN